MNAKQHLDILGYPVRDKVTGLEGVAVSVSFDLYGCIQVIVNPGIDKEGKQKEQGWYDISRIERTSKKRVMDPPDFVFTQTDEGKAAGVHGPAEKPLPRR